MKFESGEGKETGRENKRETERERKNELSVTDLSAT
jgi:hypothetical protein